MNQKISQTENTGIRKIKDLRAFNAYSSEDGRRIMLETITQNTKTYVV